MPFSGSDGELVYILISINIRLGKDRDSGQYYCDVLDYNKGTWWRCDDDKISKFIGYPDNVYDEFLHENGEKNRGKIS